jgi:hypothetical protein
MIISSIAFADTLTTEMVSQVHDQVKNSFFEGCSKGLKGSAIDICRCLAEKTAANLDDAALSQCNNDDSGKDCVVKVVRDASVKATAKDSVMECKKRAEQNTGNNSGSTSY